MGPVVFDYNKRKIQIHVIQLSGMQCIENDQLDLML